jgi:glycosyltransferase involved in cell wall biosynthesis
MKTETPQLTIITPCFNEEESVLKCFQSLQDVMSKELPDVSYEHIFADNSSTDGTVEVIKGFLKSDSRVKLIVNSKNIGAPRNIYRALSRARGSAVVPMLPADLQDPADVIPHFYREWKAGSLIVFGKRIERQENFIMRNLRGLYYRIIKKFASSDIPINVGEFMLIDRKVVDLLVNMRESNPYLRGLIAQVGVKSSFINYRWGKREFGKSKATPFVLIDTAMNGLVSTSRLPARIALLSGFILSLIGILLGFWSLLTSLFSNSQVGAGIPTIIVTMFFIGGVQLFFLGLIGEYVLSIHGKIRPEPDAFDLETLGFDNLEDENKNAR